MPPVARTRQAVGGGCSMSMERSRRDRFSTPAPPVTWEIPAAVIGAGLFLIVIMPLVVQGIVGWATSGQFAWPTSHLLDAYGGLVHGHFGAGLRHDVAAGLPPDAVMWVLATAGEVLVLGAAVVIGRWMRDLTGTDSHHGLATATQAAEALGLPRLRKSAAVIRPDLHAPAPRRPRSPGNSRREVGVTDTPPFDGKEEHHGHGLEEG